MPDGVATDCRVGKDGPVDIPMCGVTLSRLPDGLADRAAIWCWARGEAKKVMDCIRAERPGAWMGFRGETRCGECCVETYYGVSMRG